MTVRDDPDPASDVALALLLADAAREIARRHYRTAVGAGRPNLAREAMLRHLRTLVT